MIRLCPLSKVGGDQPIGGLRVQKVEGTGPLQSPWLLRLCWSPKQTASCSHDQPKLLVNGARARGAAGPALPAWILPVVNHISELIQCGCHRQAFSER